MLYFVFNKKLIRIWVLKKKEKKNNLYVIQVRKLR